MTDITTVQDVHETLDLLMAAEDGVCRALARIPTGDMTSREVRWLQVTALLRPAWRLMRDVVADDDGDYPRCLALLNHMAHDLAPGAPGPPSSSVN